FPISTPTGLNASGASRGPCDGSPTGAEAIGGLGSAAVTSSPTALTLHATLFFEGAAATDSVRFDVDGLTRTCDLGTGSGGASGGTGGRSGSGGTGGVAASDGGVGGGKGVGELCSGKSVSECAEGTVCDLDVSGRCAASTA